MTSTLWWWLIDLTFFLFFCWGWWKVIHFNDRYKKEQRGE